MSTMMKNIPTLSDPPWESSSGCRCHSGTLKEPRARRRQGGRLACMGRRGGRSGGGGAGTPHSKLSGGRGGVTTHSNLQFGQHFLGWTENEGYHLDHTQLYKISHHLLQGVTRGIIGVQIRVLCFGLTFFATVGQNNRLRIKQHVRMCAACGNYGAMPW